MNEKFIMVSLEEGKSKELARVISSDTSRKILDYLSGKDEAAESQISSALKIPISTVHYNIKHLKKAGLVESQNFAWSEKGKKVELYKVAKKIIIMAPKGSESFLEKIKTLIPVTLLSLTGAGAIYLMNKKPFLSSQETIRAAPQMLETAKTIPPPSEPNQALWFLLGSVFTIILTMLYLLYKSYKKIPNNKLFKQP